MSKVRSGNTKPEWILRCALHRLGFRYTLDNKHLPGRPDLAFPKYGAVVFVHGCYWHRHPDCKDASLPKSNTTFWEKKFAENVERDRKTEVALQNKGLRVFVVWECELTNRTVETIENLAQQLRKNSITGSQYAYSNVSITRKELLTVAENKVRYRISSYKQDSDTES